VIDCIFEKGLVYDGSGNEPYAGDIAIVGDKIECIGQLDDLECIQRINIEGLAITPGFIDLHTHSDFTLIANGKAESQVHQGVTTEVVGQCGHSCAPVCQHSDIPKVAIGYVPQAEGEGWKSFGEYLSHLDRAGLGVNVAAFVGHGAIHRMVMGDELRLPEPEEVDAMAVLVDQAMEEGAAGFSTGLEYWPGIQSTPEHIIPLCEVAARHDRLYATHVRNRDRFYDLAFGEAMATARSSGARLQISHIQPKYGAPAHAMEHTLEMLNLSRRYGVELAFDVIPHDWAHTLVMAILPRWALEGGVDKVIERLKNPTLREKMKQNRSPMWLLVADGLWSKIVLLNSRENPHLVGENFSELGRARGKHPYDVVFDLLLEEGAGMHQLLWTSQAFSQEDIDLCLEQDECAVISDTLALAPYGNLEEQLGSLSGYGWTSEFLSRYVRERKVLSLPEAVRRLTSLPAERLGLRDRGQIREGLKADLAVFDHDAISSTWTVEQPRNYPQGIRYVTVNGQLTIDAGARTENNGGGVLRAPL